MPSTNYTISDPHYRRKLFAGIALLILFLIMLIGEAMTDRIVRFWFGVIVCSFVVLCVALSVAFARDGGQWGNNDPVVTEWYKTLMQPDRPEVSCCGEGDAYWCDDYYVRDGKTFCKITGRPSRRPAQAHSCAGRYCNIHS